MLKIKGAATHREEHRAKVNTDDWSLTKALSTHVTRQVKQQVVQLETRRVLRSSTRTFHARYILCIMPRTRDLAVSYNDIKIGRAIGSNSSHIRFLFMRVHEQIGFATPGRGETGKLM